MASLAPQTRASYIVIIDRILANSDLQTVSSKRIRQGLQEEVPYDITPHKDAIKTLIVERFDKFAAEKDALPPTNGCKEESPPPPPPPQSKKKNHKRKSESDRDEPSDAPSTPAMKKRKQNVEDDAAMAARLQAEENSRARPTRGGSMRKASAPKKKMAKKKTSSKVKAEDDSDLYVSDSAKERKVNRSGGFHKLMVLSAPLSNLLDGETQLSRPQTVKRIWAYVKERDLQDPKDKRLIRCDDALKAVFKSDRVHMFTMNKILAQNLYDPDQ